MTGYTIRTSMSLDMLPIHYHAAEMTERQQQILQTAIEIIADEGYASLTMRALARACDMKLGALQYHFRTSDEMLKGLVGYISDSYLQSFADLRNANKKQPLTLEQIVNFVLEDTAGGDLFGDRLWPQLWAMQQVEPLVSDLVEDIYSTYIDTLEQALATQNCKAPRAEALLLMSLMEGATIFLGSGRRWEGDAKSFRTTILEFIESRYGGQT